MSVCPSLLATTVGQLVKKNNALDLCNWKTVGAYLHIKQGNEIKLLETLVTRDTCGDAFQCQVKTHIPRAAHLQLFTQHGC